MTDSNDCARQDGKHLARCTNPYCPGRHCAGGPHQAGTEADRHDRTAVRQTTEARMQTR